MAVVPGRGYMHSTQAVTVTGFGFENTPYLRCKFTEDRPGGAEYVTDNVTWESSSMVLCQQPWARGVPRVTGGMRVGSKIEVSLDGQMYSVTSGSTSAFVITGEPAGLVVDASPPLPAARVTFVMDAGNVHVIRVYVRDAQGNRLNELMGLNDQTTFNISAELTAKPNNTEAAVTTPAPTHLRCTHAPLPPVLTQRYPRVYSRLDTSVRQVRRDQKGAGSSCVRHGDATFSY